VLSGNLVASPGPGGSLQWADGRPARFASCWSSPSTSPGTLTNGTQSDAQLVAIELAHLTAQSLALRKLRQPRRLSRREGMVDPWWLAFCATVVLGQT